MNVQKPVYECTGICKQAGRAALLLQRPASVHLRFKRWTRNYLLDARPCLLVAEEEDLRGVVVLVLEAPVLRALTDVLGASGALVKVEESALGEDAAALAGAAGAFSLAVVTFLALVLDVRVLAVLA